MIHLFDSVLNGAQVRNVNTQRSLVLARDVVITSIEDTTRILTDAEVVVARAKAALEALEVKKRMIESSLEDVTPLALAQDSMLVDIPNVEDLEHMETVEF
ncbi:hypothetical protein DYB25_010704 [Aphanomyces astaci]|uniref:Uncharacterized protein n=1 Tax=Aphanomyces astaci TaxID=112090 RepID=A0A397EU07_APHAT|nr:hypothetical protein DYB36_013718 [Aphanomyces astaci]RHY01123.1 hypothetical protein DYB25_010704 [Aphanomyces astaci]RHY53558.1 hypothetical protein DYB38_013558 [Aphanomyces astaci]RHY63977.1 hypothetical protein DYB34_009875 [Aphanomyces astaci]RHY79476.1 hypothetical protein DYB30_012404 [Aphanomyces astaci]